MELNAVIAKAKDELAKLEPRKSFLDQVQETLDEFDVEREQGEEYFGKAERLAEILTTGLNVIIEKVAGTVELRSDSLTITSDAGSITYDPNENEWYFSGL